MRRWRGSITVVATAALVAGLAALSTTSGSTPAVASGDYGQPTSTDAATTVAPTTEPSTTTTSSTTSSSTTTTTTTSTTTTTTSSTTTTTVVVPAPWPTSVTPSLVRIAPGDAATISGTCPVVGGVALGPVVVWAVGDTIDAIDTGLSGAEWTYSWQSPVSADVVALQVWCGDPTGWTGGYPSELVITVEYVAQGTRPSAGDDGDGTTGDDASGGTGPGFVLPDSR